MASGGVHLVSGFVVGTFAPSPGSAFAAGVVSHAVFDAIPHREYVTWTANVIDTGAALALVSALTARLPREVRMRAVVGAIGAVLPDVETMGTRVGLVPADRKLFPSHNGRIRHGRGGPVWTASVSIATVGVALLAAERVRRRATS